MRLALANFRIWVRRHGSEMGGLAGRGAEKRMRAEDQNRHVESRARFWAELRDGQREAEAHSARRDS